jgi:hypothetical protein
MHEVETPPDADDWARIVREQVGAGVRVEFVSTRSDQWRVAVVDAIPVNVREGPWDHVNPIDMRPQVITASREAGKPVDD